MSEGDPMFGERTDFTFTQNPNSVTENEENFGDNVISCIDFDSLELESIDGFDYSFNNDIPDNEKDKKETSSGENSKLTVHQGYVPMNNVYALPIVQVPTQVPAPTDSLYVGKSFCDVQSLRKELRDIAISHHFELKAVKSDTSRYTVKCAQHGCTWRLHAHKDSGAYTFTIRTICPEHTCNETRDIGHQQASVDWIVENVEKCLIDNPNYSPKDIIEYIHGKHGTVLPYKQAWRAKEKIIASLRSSFEEDYSLLSQYCDQIKVTNPGSIASVYVHPEDNSFRRLFVSFHASIYGFVNALRPVILVDSTTLKNQYLGSTLLFATAFDGEDMLFPVAFGVVCEESDDNWVWFLQELQTLIEKNSENMPRLTILSDMRKGIKDGVESILPTAFHGFSINHLIESFRKHFPDTNLVNLFREVSNALTHLDYERKMNEIREVSLDAAHWIGLTPPHLWASAFFEGICFNHLTEITLEPLSSLISEASRLPIVQMMECFRRKLMIWFNERRETSMQWTSILTPCGATRVAEAIELARACQVTHANESLFQVLSYERMDIVHIQNRSCTCRGWQINGLPCAHAVAALFYCEEDVHLFTESCFTVENYRKAYSMAIHPIPDKIHWENISEGIIVNPPRVSRPSGQIRKRRASASVSSSSGTKRLVHCSRCHQAGHFRTTCAASI